MKFTNALVVKLVDTKDLKNIALRYFIVSHSLIQS